MKKLQFLTLLLFVVSFAFGQSKGEIVIGKIDSIDSKILKEQRKVWVYVPEEGADIFSKQAYPVVYLLDGSGHFHSVVGLIRQLSSVNGNTICPKMIVVGITNTNRTRDLTPSKGDANHEFVDSAMVAASGGGENFISFIEKELFPHIEANYPASPYRMLIGHSIGGLTALNTLFHHTELFNSYVAIDPSMWWSNRKLLNEFKNSPKDKKYEGVSLYLGIANTMEEGMDLERVKKDTSQNTGHIRSIFELHEYLNGSPENQLNYQGKYYADDDHGSVPLISEYDAIRHIFGFYRLKVGYKDYMDPKVDLSQKLTTHYEHISKKFGYEVKPEESFVNMAAYQLFSMKQGGKAAQLFKLNVNNYPDSFNAYDSLGDYYNFTGDREKAIENYKKSLLINEQSPSKKKLEALGKE